MNARQIHESERASGIATVVSAFTHDPVERWMYPSSDEYETHFPKFVDAFGGEAIRNGSAWEAGSFAAVAFWLPPEVSPDGDVIVELLSTTVSPDKHEDLFAVLGQMDEKHPTYPHWYLPWLGVMLEHQGEGLGEQLLSEGLAIVDADGLPAYLETPNPRTVPFYERHGFEVVGTAEAGSCPPVTLMLRPAR
jgi:ribosomal protein S18 acetylase RimI-like enzyme